MENIDYKTRKIQEKYVNNKGVTKIRTIREEYTETNTYYYEKDEKGSITKITDKDGTTIEQYLYDAYGTPYTKTQSGELVTISNLKPSLIGNTRLYTGREYDRGLQLYYNRARYYNPQLGRFLSRDPIDISDDVNLYTYVGNNPVMFVDRMGLEKELIIMGNPNNPNDPKEVAMFDNTVKYQIEKLMKEGVMLENIELIGNVMTPEQFNNAVKKYLGNIKSITYMAHGTQYTTGDITIDNVSELNSIKVDSNDNPSIMLLSCQTGKGNNSIAQNLSNTLGVNVNAPTVNVAVYDKEDFEYSFDNIIYHGDLVIKGMYTDIGEPTIGLIGEWKTFYPSLNLIN